MSLGPGKLEEFVAPDDCNFKRNLAQRPSWTAQDDSILGSAFSSCLLQSGDSRKGKLTKQNSAALFLFRDSKLSLLSPLTFFFGIFKFNNMLSRFGDSNFTVLLLYARTVALLCTLLYARTCVRATCYLLAKLSPLSSKAASLF